MLSLLRGATARAALARHLSSPPGPALDPPAAAAAALQAALDATRLKLPGKKVERDLAFELNLKARARALMQSMAEAPVERGEKEFKEKGPAPVPKTIEQNVDGTGRAFGRGARKAAWAQVWVKPAADLAAPVLLVNRVPLAEYFNYDVAALSRALSPLVVTKTLGTVDITCTVGGGGKTGQAGAIQWGLTKALQSGYPGWRPWLKDAKLLTRDMREVERKKAGQPKARKKFTWVKR